MHRYSVRVIASLVTCGSAVLVAGCSGDSSSEPPPQTTQATAGLTYSPHSVGFGEALNTDGGAHRVLSMETDAESDSVEPDAGRRVVTALVEECASPRGPITASSKGWSVLTQPASNEPITSPVELQPTTEGAPSVTASRRIDADSCAMGDLVFVVPDDADVLGFHYQQAGSRTANWILTPG